MRDDLAGLVVFLAVADRMSFTAAAVHLGISASAVSQSLRQLEKKLGVRLLQRTTRSVGLTEAGRQLVDRVRPAVCDLTSALESLDAFRSRPTGILRLNVPRLALASIVEPVLATFLKAYPEIRVDIAVDDGLVDIVKAGFDAGIRTGEKVANDMVAVKISDELRLAIVASPAYLTAHGCPKVPRDIQQHACIRYRFVTSGALFRWELTADGEPIELAVDGRLIVNDPGLMVRGALDGVGLAQVFVHSVTAHLEHGTLVEVLGAFSTPFAGYYLYYPSRAEQAPKLRAFVDVLKNQYTNRARGERGPAGGVKRELVEYSFERFADNEDSQKKSFARLFCKARLACRQPGARFEHRVCGECAAA